MFDIDMWDLMIWFITHHPKVTVGHIGGRCNSTWRDQGAQSLPSPHMPLPSIINPVSNSTHCICTFHDWDTACWIDAAGWGPTLVGVFYTELNRETCSGLVADRYRPRGGGTASLQGRYPKQNYRPWFCAPTALSHRPCWYTAHCIWGIKG